jgi:hypothetical protein
MQALKSFINGTITNGKKVMNKVTQINGSSSNVGTPNAIYRKLQQLRSDSVIMYNGESSLEVQKYLHKLKYESDEDYALRLKFTFFKPFYKKIVDFYTSKVFHVEPKFNDLVLTDLKDILEDINCLGDDKGVFFKNVFKDAVINGLTFVLVDLPSYNTEIPQTSEQRKPYCVHIKPENVIGWRYDVVEGKTKLLEVRVRERYTEEDDNYESITVETISIFKDINGIITKEVYKERKNGVVSSIVQALGSNYEKVDEVQLNGISSIPLCALYLNKTGFFEATPPLYDLAKMNIEHYILDSQYKDVLRTHTIPILCFTGMGGYDDELKKQPIKPKSFITLSGDAKASYVELSKAPIESARESILDLEKQMAIFGVSFDEATQVKSNTATGRVLDANEMNSPIKSWVETLEDFIEQVLYKLYEWKYDETEYSAKVKEFEAMDFKMVEFDTSFGMNDINNVTVDNILSLYTSGLVTQELALQILQEKKVISETADIDSIVAQTQIQAGVSGQIQANTL